MPSSASLQIGLGTFGVALMSLTPPPAGLMLVVPPPGTPVAATIAWTTGHDARIAGIGPLPGSLIVEGARARLLPAALARPALLLDARFANCASSGIAR